MAVACFTQPIDTTMNKYGIVDNNATHLNFREFNIKNKEKVKKVVKVKYKKLIGISFIAKK